MKVNNLKSLLGDLKCLPAEVEASGHDLRYLVETLKCLGFKQENASYYGLKLEYKGKRVKLGCKLRGSTYTVTMGNKKVAGGHYVDYVQQNADNRRSIKRWYANSPSMFMPNYLDLFDGFRFNN